MTKATEVLMVRFLKQHSRKCWFVTGQSRDFPWVISDTYTGLRHENRSVDGRRIMKSGGYRFIPFRCNCPECPARGVIRLDTIEQLIPREADHE